MPQRHLPGARLRDARQARKIRQRDLAARVGVSASYLNLIEHGRRRITSPLLERLAQELAIPPETLSDGAPQAQVQALRAAAALGRGDEAGAEEFLARHPAWAQLVLDQARRIDNLRARVGRLTDRLSHDPQLAAALHDLLSSVTSVRSTASILVDGDELDRAWQDRFLTNLDQDAQRLSAGAEQLAVALQRSTQDSASPLDEAEAALTRLGGHVPGLEEGRSVAEVLDQMALTGAARRIAQTQLDRLAQDIAALPLEAFTKVAQACDHDPLRVMAQVGVPLAQVLRRMASLPSAGHPAMGLAICDGAGAVLYRLPVADVVLPRAGAACPLWPIYTAMVRPGQAVAARVDLPGAGGVDVWAIADVMVAPHPDHPPRVEATMLVRPVGDVAESGAIPVGPGCRICPREACAARREPSVLGRTFESGI